MKNSILSLLFLIVSILVRGQSVPDTNTFSLLDVYNVVSTHASPSPNLQSCFDNADSSYFDPGYNNDTYAPANSLLRFRNYGFTATLPTVVTALVSNISTTSATSGGNVTDDGGVTVTSRGICWNTSGDPTIINDSTLNGSGTGNFTSNLSGLTSGTTYYVRAYAINSIGIAYGNQISFTTAEQQVACGGSAYYSGGLTYPGVYAVTLGSGTGIVNMDFNAITVPDLFIVEYNGSIVVNTGYRGGTQYDFGGSSRSTFKNSLNGKVDPTGGTYPDSLKYPDDGYPRVTYPGNGSVSFDKTTSTANATVKMYAPISGTAWNFTIACPSEPLTSLVWQPVNGNDMLAVSQTTEEKLNSTVLTEAGVYWEAISDQPVTNTWLTDEVSADGVKNITDLEMHNLNVTVDLSYTKQLSDSKIDVVWVASVNPGIAPRKLEVNVICSANDETGTLKNVIIIDKGNSSGSLKMSYPRPGIKEKSYRVNCSFDPNQEHSGYKEGISPVSTTIEKIEK